MAFGKLILTTEIGGLKEVMKNYKNKINLYDKDAIKKIKVMLGKKYGFDLKDFDWSKISKLYLKQLEQSYGKK